MSLSVCGLAVGRSKAPILSNLSFEIAGGQRVTLVGANGCGKTTLLHVLAGLDSPLAGEIKWPHGALPKGPARVRVIGVLFQSEAPTPLTVRELVTLGLGLDGPPSAQRAAQVDEILARFDLDGVSDRPCTRLSGGEWQRAALARALVAGPEILLLDEPTSHLDPGRREDLLDLLDGLRRVTIVAATHDLDFAAACDRVVILGDGGLLAFGTPAEALTDSSLSRAFGLRHWRRSA